jgi:hypothetical protein
VLSISGHSDAGEYKACPGPRAQAQVGPFAGSSSPSGTLEGDGRVGLCLNLVSQKVSVKKAFTTISGIGFHTRL